jgi:hypothetical protein
LLVWQMDCSARNDVHSTRHRPRKRAIQYSRDTDDKIAKPQRTGYPFSLTMTTYYGAAQCAQTRNPSPLLHQRIARRGELQKFPRAAAAVRVRALGDALVGPVDFDTGQPAAERQSQQLPVTLLRAQ